MLNKSVPKILSLGFALSSLSLLALNTKSAQAATLTFDFMTGAFGNIGSTTSIPDNTDTESVTVNGFKDLPSSNSGNIHRRNQANNPGFGIVGSPQGNRLGTNNSNQEALAFDFGEEVTLDSVDFTAIQNAGSLFDLFIDGNLALDDELVDDTVSIGLMGTMFTFITSNNNSTFRIASLIAEFDDNGGPMPSTPEPYSGITLITLGGLFAFSRFRLKNNYLSSSK